VHTISPRPDTALVETTTASALIGSDTDPSAAPTEIAQLDAALRALLHRGGPALQARIEHRLVHVAYELCAHNQVRTAQLLGITRNVLRSQLIRFGYLMQTGARRAVRPPRA
jgi:sigma-54-specific transcriptional regulator